MSWAPKRFWTEARAVPAPGGFTVHLDARPVRTPAKAPLILPTEALARHVAAEWDAQTTEVRPETMPATRMANSAIDKVMPQQAAVVGEVVKYGGSDLLCYRAEGPAELAARQQAWDRMLDWAADRLGARLAVTAGVIPVAQPTEALARLQAEVETMSPHELAALHDLVAISGSLVLGLAVAQGALPGAEAFALSRIDEAYQAEKWGTDDEAAAAEDKRRAAFLAAETFSLLCR